jgi:dihydrofolate reductase
MKGIQIDMRDIILDLAVSLDAFIEGPNGETDWCIMEDDFPGFLSGIDTIFYGRVSYDMWGNYTPEVSAGLSEQVLWKQVHSKQKYVFSRESRVDENAIFISNDIPEKVMEIKKQKGKDIWLYGGANLIKSFINLGLIDTYRISVHPVVLGSGKPLFEGLKDRLNLKLIETNRFSSEVVQLVYKPVN